jgi:hypothetical protein
MTLKHGVLYYGANQAFENNFPKNKSSEKGDRESFMVETFFCLLRSLMVT